ncbi:IcmT/TraK family protein [Rahnella sp. BCC 1045]|uniref:IcmT/TraK family protein n=1 Tax=Rahnella sp. BCC 1045 TaxID=2816251 RepID=UPI001C2785D4|nr:IcmT/TraK family protein [Rahnella sp. BCC 1045]MBU9819670.1 IcmT/TraK family protein [Rahnella sp. BCC 1045]
MNDNKQHWPPGYWRDAGRSMNVYGVPGGLFLLYLFWFRFPSMHTLYAVSLVIGAFRILQMFGWSVSVLIGRLVRLMRGKSLSGRPWWYRRFTDGE